MLLSQTQSRVRGSSHARAPHYRAGFWVSEEVARAERIYPCCVSSRQLLPSHSFIDIGINIYL